MQVLINRCYGGFNISGQVLFELIENKSELIKVHKFNEWFTSTHEYETDAYKEFKPDWLINSWENIIINNITKLVYRLNEGDDPIKFRSNKELINIFNKLGKEKFSGPFADIQLIDIPDNIEVKLSEYDGVEWIAEKHRTWP